VTTHALSFDEILEDEYRYFFTDEPFKAVKFGPGHVRDIGGLAHYLETIFDPESKSESRWQLLARRCYAAKGRTNGKPLPEKVVVKSLNGMLAEPGLLDELMKDEQFREQLTTSPGLQQSLLRIPKARRLLLERPELHSVMADDDLIDAFASRSPALRLLVNDGFRPALRMYPALLSTIADDDALSNALKDQGVRETVVRAFGVSRRSRAAIRVAGWMPRRVAEWIGRRLIARPLVSMSRDAAELHRQVDPDADRISDGAIEPEHLSRFNGLLIETAYCHYVSNGQTVRALYHAIREKETAALCLSGGGIRSATFNLGILQGLADHRMLNRFHYLSTVSGGGYIGSWLSSWTRRHQEGAVGVARDLSRKPADPLQPEVQPIRHLREYSSYLAPRTSVFSLDPWTLLATYVRNLLLNWMMLVPFLAAVLALPRLMEAYVRESMTLFSDSPAVISMLLMFVTVIVVSVLRPICRIVDGGNGRSSFLWWWLVPLLASGIAFCLYWVSPWNAFVNGPWLLVVMFTFGTAAGAVVYKGRRLRIDLGADLKAAISSEKSMPRKVLDVLTPFFRLRRSIILPAFLEVPSAALAGAAVAWLLHFSFVHAFPADRLQTGIRAEVYVCLALPLFLSIFVAGATLLVGFTTIWTEEYDREWWARCAAALLVYGVLHVLATFAVLLLPALIFESPKLTAPLGGLAGIASWLLSRQLKNGRSDEGAAKRRWLMPLLRLAAGITMMFAVAAISIATSALIAVLNRRGGDIPLPGRLPSRWLSRFLDFTPVKFPHPWLVFGDYPGDVTVAHFHLLRVTTPGTLLFFVAVATVLAISMSRLLNVNVYSMHGMYRNRLMRAYLGASRWTRRPDPFTGFDPQDNVKMWELRPEVLWPTRIVDFEAFARQLPRETFWNRLPADARNHVCAYVAAKTPQRQRALRDVARTVVVDAINELLFTRDLRHDVEAKPSRELLDANRAYLDERFPQLIRRFDRKVDLPPAEHPSAPCHSPGAPREFGSTEKQSVHGRPPLHVINAALNLVAGDNLAWQERKAASFTISPLHAGNRQLGYRDSFEYGGGVTLGTALAISGAAVSPNAGAASSPTFTFLMTLLNARLGWWLGNPKHRRYGKSSPTGSILALLREALGKTDAEHPFVFLSDGGHFDNLGLYEMVLRRCKYIVVCDASADGGYAFGDLGKAIRQIRIDLGVPIEPLTTKYIGPQKDEKYGRYCALGEIHYGNVDGEPFIGHLLYIKPALYSECPADIRNYGKESQTFPHESTADQFFSESQFESYRALGRHIIGRICGDPPDATDDHDEGPAIAPNVGAFFGNAFDYIHDTQPPKRDAPVETMNDVVSWMSASLG
jgi:patatin-like phospholipase